MDNTKFAISAKTFTILDNHQQDGGTLLNNNAKYIIPIYQRPYSWTNEQINKLLRDIFDSYWNLQMEVSPEPIFIGTMQLSLSYSGKYEREVIDGQQRITTILLLLHTLDSLAVNSPTIRKINYDWLETRVNNGEQQKFLQEYLSADNNDPQELKQNYEGVNPYFKNAITIGKFVSNFFAENGIKTNEIDEFVKHIVSNLYFVVVETRALLSKTLQIFNAINTTGLDLGGADIFKIRMYEYLRAKKNLNESVFNDISSLYSIIDKENEKLGYEESNMQFVLRIYQFYLIAKYKLPTVLYSFGTDTFFDRLFDTILGNENWEHFRNNVDSVELNLNDIEGIISARFAYVDLKWHTAEEAYALSAIDYSRYGRYSILVFILLYRFRIQYQDYWEKTCKVIVLLSKYYFIYSIIYSRAVNHVHSVSFQLNSLIVNSTYEEIVDFLKMQIGTIEKYTHSDYANLLNTLNGEITYNAKTKYAICRLVALLNEDYLTSDEESIREIERKLFEDPIDIEHIQSYNDIDLGERAKVKAEWGSEINSLGNLMVIEQSINRSISNIKYCDKIGGYKKSKYGVVRLLIESNTSPNWNKEDAQLRKTDLIENILSYVFNHN